MEQQLQEKTLLVSQKDNHLQIIVGMPHKVTENVENILFLEVLNFEFVGIFRTVNDAFCFDKLELLGYIFKLKMTIAFFSLTDK